MPKIFTIVTPKGTEIDLPEDSEVVVALDSQLYTISITKT